LRARKGFYNQLAAAFVSGPYSMTAANINGPLMLKETLL
jgi:hypothetical protein